VSFHVRGRLRSHQRACSPTDELVRPVSLHPRYPASPVSPVRSLPVYGDRSRPDAQAGSARLPVSGRGPTVPTVSASASSGHVRPDPRRATWSRRSTSGTRCASTGCCSWSRNDPVAEGGPGRQQGGGPPRHGHRRRARGSRPRGVGLELRRGGPSYTADTLAELAAAHPGAVLHLVLGSDAAAGLATWERVAEVRALTRLVVVTRPGGRGRAAARRLGPHGGGGARASTCRAPSCGPGWPTVGRSTGW
jgi:hypothetical protein